MAQGSAQINTEGLYLPELPFYSAHQSLPEGLCGIMYDVLEHGQAVSLKRSHRVAQIRRSLCLPQLCRNSAATVIAMGKWVHNWLCSYEASFTKAGGRVDSNSCSILPSCFKGRLTRSQKIYS